MIGPFLGDKASTDRSLYFWNLNTNKRSITLDIAAPQGREVFEKLVRTADVVVETFEPGYMESIGLGYGRLSTIKPDIILTSVTGFGQDGPHAHYRWSDIVGVAMSGMMTLAGDPADAPNRPCANQGYIGAGIQAAAGTLMALVYRDNTGEGQHVDVSMQEALSINQETAIQTWDMTKAIRTRTGARGAIPIDIPGIGVYECTDGQVFAYLGTPGGAPWTVMLDWMNSDGMAEDLNEEPYLELIQNLNLAFLTGLVREPEKLPARIQALTHLYGVFSRFCASKSKWHLYQEGQNQRLMFGIVSTPEDLVKNPQLAHRKWLQPVEHDHLQATVTYAGPPYRLSETPWAIRRRPPLAGEHTVEVLTEAGYTGEQIDGLRASGVI
jgi:crotonobetainyl-CoA:carnitine CoA-transferase CaiB-like acyl-CoA transferase